MSGSSRVPSTCEWLARICSSSVDPARGSPTMKTGSREGQPAPARAAKNYRVKSARVRSTRRVLRSGS
jgi:hypothetical protein